MNSKVFHRLESEIKVLILAGGLGTRISEETDTKPKPMVLVDDKPILWHVMSIYAGQGYSDFIIATGYKSEVISNWISTTSLPWRVSSIDTGLNTQTAGRIRKVISNFPPQTWLVTYGDGLGNINIKELLKVHQRMNTFVTVTAVRPPARFGSLSIKNGLVESFGEKTQSDSGWINGGFFAIEPETISYIDETKDSFEMDTLPRLSQLRELSCYLHYGYWKPMDTLREKNELALDCNRTPKPWLDFN